MNEATKLTNNMWNMISKIVHKCERAQDSNQKFMTNFKRAELCDDLRQAEELRLQKQIQQSSNVNPEFLKEILFVRHKERIIRN